MPTTHLSPDWAGIVRTPREVFAILARVYQAGRLEGLQSDVDLYRLATWELGLSDVEYKRTLDNARTNAHREIRETRQKTGGYIGHTPNERVKSAA